MRLAAVREPIAISPRIVVAAGLGTALLVGAALAASPPAGVALLIAAFYVPLAFLNLPLALASWIPLVFIMRLGLFSVAPTACLLLLTLAWLGTLRKERAEDGGVAIGAHAPLLAVIGAFLVWLLVSAIWATSPSAALGDFSNWVTPAFVFVLGAFAGSESHNARRIAWAFVIGSLLSVVVGFVPGLEAPVPADALTSAENADRQRLTGGGGDPNFLAAGIVPAMALMAGLARRGVAGMAAFMVPATAILGFGLLATASRGGLISAGVAVVAALFLFKARRPYVLVVLLILGAFGAAWFAANRDALDRVTSTDNGGNGRTDLWRVAIRVWENSPVLGAGLNNFTVVSGDYVREPGQLDFVQLIVEHPHVTHNAYLQMLAETGVVGLLLFVAVFVAAMRASLQAAERFSRHGDENMANLSRALAIAVLAAASGSVFLSNGGDWRNWILFGLSSGLLAASKRVTPGRLVSG